MVNSLKMWRHYLLGKKFELIIDLQSLKYLFEQPLLNAREAKWLELLGEYEYEIKHIKGK